eukprot:TRINITY_DN5624_c5_g1_i1.p1 TRINITY_DN5624_c5_g1~~TRINITY_DN5624_c5_g1_i1.p1  ORF type:complete len:260 (+),score=63.96 TRINITY_DN5624_c5_g1_i1:30-809(+)
MAGVGEKLYALVSQIHPELAPKLTGMLLQLGEDECYSCLEDGELLAARLDEAISILDSAGGIRNSAPKPKPKPKAVAKSSVAVDPNVRRRDPEDGEVRSYRELSDFYSGPEYGYSQQEIREYWDLVCRPLKDAAEEPKVPKRAAVDASPEPPVAVPAPETEHPAASVAAAPAPGPVNSSSETLEGLTFWLAELKLSGYYQAVSEWAEEQGACHLDEMVEVAEDLANDIKLKPLEKKRLLSGAQAAAEKALSQAGVASDA